MPRVLQKTVSTQVQKHKDQFHHWYPQKTQQGCYRETLAHANLAGSWITSESKNTWTNPSSDTLQQFVQVFFDSNVTAIYLFIDWIQIAHFCLLGYCSYSNRTLLMLIDNSKKTSYILWSTNGRHAQLYKGAKRVSSGAQHSWHSVNFREPKDLWRPCLTFKSTLNLLWVSNP